MGRTKIKKNNTGKGKGKSLAALKRKQFMGGGINIDIGNFRNTPKQLKNQPAKQAKAVAKSAKSAKAAEAARAKAAKKAAADRENQRKAAMAVRAKRPKETLPSVDHGMGGEGGSGGRMIGAPVAPPQRTAGVPALGGVRKQVGLPVDFSNSADPWAARDRAAVKAKLSMPLRSGTAQVGKPVALPPGTQKTTTSAKDKAAQAAVAKAKAKANPKDVANTNMNMSVSNSATAAPRAATASPRAATAARGATAFDSEAYLALYPDLQAHAKANPNFNAERHYANHGQYENRDSGQGADYKAISTGKTKSTESEAAKKARLLKEVETGQAVADAKRRTTGAPKADVVRTDTEGTMFNAEAYMAANLDLQQYAKDNPDFDPYEHYLDYGADEIAKGLYGRKFGTAPTTVTGEEDIQTISGSDAFNERSYMEANPDLRHYAKTHPEFDPYQHYLNYGKNEGREGGTRAVKADTVTAKGGTTVTGPTAQGEEADDITANTYDAELAEDLDPTEAAVGNVTREGEATQATLTTEAEGATGTQDEIDAGLSVDAAQRPDSKDYATAARDDDAPITVEDVDGPAVTTRTAETMSEEEKQDLLGIVTTEGVDLEGIPEFKLAKERKAQVGDAKTKVANELGDAPSVDFEGRQAITGTAPKGDASQIGGIPTAAAAAMSAITGAERMAGAADMMAVVAKIPADITAAISEDPATVAAQLDSGTDPATIAAVAALPVEALVSTQMENLLAGMEEGKTPVWARPAVAQIEQMMASRGLSASTVGRDALFNAIIQSALPMAQSNAQALQQRAQQNLSNEQQANMSTAQNTMQIRMQNLANQQTAASQSADMAQQIKVQQGSFNQQAVMTSAQQKQETNLANAQLAQQRAQQESAQRQQVAISNLGAGVQSDLANLQYLNATASQNMTAEQQSRLATYNSQIARTMRQADLEQDMEKANLSGELQVELSNLTEENAASKDTMSAENQERLTNLNTLVDFKKTNASLAQQMDLANLNNEQQMELANLSERAATDSANMTEANRMKLQELTIYTSMMAKNEDLRQGAEMAQLSASEKVQLANLTFKNQADAQSMSAANNAELQVYERKMQAGQVNAQLAQQMGLANLSNEQSATMFNAQMDANMDMKQFDSNQQIALSNSQFMKTVSLKNLDNRQQAAMQNATALASMDMANADALTRVSVENAKNFLAMDMANLSNDQQGRILDQQMKQQQYLSEAAASNASKQFNATSKNQTEQFMVGVGQQMEQFNAAQANAMTQSNVSEQNRMTAIREGNTLEADKITATLALQAKTFNADMDAKAEQWNAANAQAVEQSNITWRRSANTAATAAQNAANQQSASFEFNMTTADQANFWQDMRQSAQNDFASDETERDRIVNVVNAALQNEELMTNPGLRSHRDELFRLLTRVTGGAAPSGGPAVSVRY